VPKEFQVVFVSHKVGRSRRCFVLRFCLMKEVQVGYPVYLVFFIRIVVLSASQKHRLPLVALFYFDVVS
jgi:hypothetical protein